jgi:hypothetical protein
MNSLSCAPGLLALDTSSVGGPNVWPPSVDLNTKIAESSRLKAGGINSKLRQAK